jgi:hypothetical protein
MHYNTAVAFIICGLGLIACPLGWQRLSWGTSAALVLLGFAELLHAWGAVDFGLGEWWLTPPSGMSFFTSGSASAASALCLCIAGAALTLISWPNSQGASHLVLALLGTVLLFVSLLGVFGFPLAFELGIVSQSSVVQLAFQELAGFVVVGLAVLAYAFRTDVARPAPRPWLPLFVGLSGTTVTVLFWQALTTQESHRVQRMVQFEAAQVQRQISEGLPLRLQALLDLAGRWQGGRSIASADLSEAADRYVVQQPGCLGVALAKGEAATMAGDTRCGAHAAGALDGARSGERVRQCRRVSR